MDCSSMTKGTNGAVYQVWNVLGSLTSCCFSHFIGRADGLLVGADHSGSEGEGKGSVVSLVAEGVGRKTRARIDMKDGNIL